VAVSGQKKKLRQGREERREEGGREEDLPELNCNRTLLAFAWGRYPI
jgi:hypothetical protein